jgi:hypothetical protein
MIIYSHRQWLVTFMGLAVLTLAPGLAVAQESSKSAALAKELVALMDQAKATTIAAKDPAKEDEYVAAMYFPGSQMVVVSARYAVPMYVNEKLARKDFMEVYIDLNSASVPQSKIFVSDLQANGLMARPEEGQPFDTYEAGGKTTAFDRDWKKRDISEQDYMKAFTDADDRYAKMLSILVEQMKKKS